MVDRRAHLIPELAEVIGLFVRDPFGGARRDEAFDRLPDLGDLDCFGDGHLPHARAAIRLHLNQALGRQLDQRVAQHEAARAVLLGQFGLDQALARCVGAAQNCLAELIAHVGVVGHRVLPLD